MRRDRANAGAAAPHLEYTKNITKKLRALMLGRERILFFGF
jgi:hypothetical protein